MEYFSEEAHDGWFGGVLFREVDVEFQNSAFPLGFVGTDNDGLPLHHVRAEGLREDAYLKSAAEALTEVPVFLLELVVVAEHPSSCSSCHLTISNFINYISILRTK